MYLKYLFIILFQTFDSRKMKYRLYQMKFENVYIFTSEIHLTIKEFKSSFNIYRHGYEFVIERPVWPESFHFFKRCKFWIDVN